MPSGGYRGFVRVWVRSFINQYRTRICLHTGSLSGGQTGRKLHTVMYAMQYANASLTSSNSITNYTARVKVIHRIAFVVQRFREHSLTVSLVHIRHRTQHATTSAPMKCGHLRALFHLHNRAAVKRVIVWAGRKEFSDDWKPFIVVCKPRLDSCAEWFICVVCVRQVGLFVGHYA